MFSINLLGFELTRPKNTSGSQNVSVQDQDRIRICFRTPNFPQKSDRLFYNTRHIDVNSCKLGKALVYFKPNYCEVSFPSSRITKQLRHCLAQRGFTTAWQRKSRKHLRIKEYVSRRNTLYDIIAFFISLVKFGMAAKRHVTLHHCSCQTHDRHTKIFGKSKFLDRSRKVYRCQIQFFFYCYKYCSSGTVTMHHFLRAQAFLWNKISDILCFRNCHTFL